MTRSITLRRLCLQQLALLASGAALPGWVHAAGLSEVDASAGLRAALERGARAAVGQLGRPDGFLGNAALRIPLPQVLQGPAKLLRATGQGRRVDELETAINRAAEAAVPQGQTILLDAVHSLSVQDALQILRGNDTAVTTFFAERTRTPLGAAFLPIVTQATEQVSLARKYEAVASRASRFGLISATDADLPGFVTGKALDGLFNVIATEEKKIRRDPVGTGEAILKSVFGALK
jgi:Protein of unknown function (DUF4197)